MANTPTISLLPPLPAGTFSPPAVGMEQIPQIIAAIFQGKAGGEELRRQREMEDLRMEALKQNLSLLDLQAKAETLQRIREAFGDEEAAKIFASDPDLADIYRQVYKVEPTVPVTRTIQTPTVTPTERFERAPLEAPRPGMAPREQVSVEEQTVTEQVPRPLAATAKPEQVQRLLTAGQALLQNAGRRLDSLLEQQRRTGQVNSQQIWSAVQQYNAAVQMLRSQASKMGLSPIEAEAYFPSITQAEVENIIRDLRQPTPVSPKDISEAMRTQALANFLTGRSTPEERMVLFGGKDPYDEDSKTFVLGGRAYQIKDLTDAKIYYLTDPNFRTFIQQQGPEAVRMLTGMDPYGPLDPRKLIDEAAKAFRDEYIKLQGLVQQYRQLQQQLADLKANPQTAAQNATLVQELTKKVSQIAAEISASQGRLKVLIREKEYIQDPGTGQWVKVDLDAIVAEYAGKIFPYYDIWSRLSPEGRQYLIDNGVYPPGAFHTRGR